MNYINQIKTFWISQEGNQLSTTDIALYFYLLEICNRCAWAGTFKRNNAKVYADLSLSYKTLQASRDRLRTVGLIEFWTKNGDPNVTYRINELGNISKGEGRGEGRGSVGGEGRGSGRVNINSNINLNQTDNPSADDAADPEPALEIFQSEELPEKSGKEERKKSCAKKKKEEKRKALHWRELTSVWFQFYGEQHKGIRPRFSSAEGAKLRDILVALEDHAQRHQQEWTVDFAKGVFLQFLQTAWADSWLRTKFLLRNIDSQFDVILAAMINPQAAAKPAGKVPAVHQNSDVLKSVLSKIYTPNSAQQ